jgi:hypothetical protein
MRYAPTTCTPGALLARLHESYLDAIPIPKKEIFQSISSTSKTNQPKFFKTNQKRKVSDEPEQGLAEVFSVSVDFL